MGKRRDSKGRILRTGESQKKNGRYVFQYTDFSGKRRCVYSSRLEKTDRYPEGALKKDKALREKEEEILFNKANGLFDFGGDLTVIELAERYVATRTNVKESTKAGYRTTLNFLRKEPFSQKRIDKVKQTEVKLWLIKLQQEDGKRYSSIRNIRSVLKPAFQMAVDDDLIRKNPFAFPLGQIIHDDTKKRIALSPEQEEQFLSFVHEHPHYSRYYEGVYILLNTGLRVSEFCGLTMADIDFKEHCIHVTGQLLRHSNMVLEFETPKTDAGTRDIPMTPEVEHCFRNLIKKRERMTVEPIVGGKAGFLYLDKYKRPVVALHWEHYFRGMISAYNRSHSISLPNFTPHNCRHTFSTKMSRMGMYPKNLQYIMGHSDYKVTMNTYTHLDFEDAVRELKRVNEQRMIG